MPKKTIGIALIPAYQPTRLLLDLLEELRAAGMVPVVIDDGSSPQADPLFSAAAEYGTVLIHPVNLGKGSALKTGFSYLQERFSEQDFIVVTMDADGQHRVKDALLLWNAAEEHPDTLVLGSRRLEGEVPLRSRLGNRATRLAYRLSTGVSVADTQTGLRAFSSGLVPRMLAIPGDRYEYEMNVLLLCAKEGIPILELPIATIYLNHNASSHFHTFRDSLRVYREILKFTATSIFP